MHTLISGIKYTAQLPVLNPLIVLGWLSVCLLVLGTGVVVLVSRIFQFSRRTLLQIMRA